ncbi:MAG: antitoxin [Acidobacteria bacterium]|nr:antitoxin [Acidobacteriota bacterium]
MRSTVRIEDDLMVELRTRAHAESLSLTRIINRTLRAGLWRPEPEGGLRMPFKQRTAAMGRPRVDLDKALALAAALEDDEVARKVSLRK